MPSPKEAEMERDELIAWAAIGISALVIALLAIGAMEIYRLLALRQLAAPQLPQIPRELRTLSDLRVDF